MKKKGFCIFICAALLVTTQAYAQREPSYNNYKLCLQTATVRKENLLEKGRVDYRKKSDAIHAKAMRGFGSASWYVDTSYRLNAKKILDARKKEFEDLETSMKQLRASIDETYKADESLCRLQFLGNSTTTKIR
jgi:hypothetical protein